MSWVRTAMAAAVMACSLPASARVVDGEARDLIRWIGESCPKAADTESVIRLDQVAGKAVTDWLRTGRYRDAVELALVYARCLEGHGIVKGSEGLDLRLATLRKVVCFIPLVVIESEQEIDADLAARALAACPAPSAEVPEDDGSMEEWAEDLRRYVHLLAATADPGEVLAVSSRYLAALRDAGFDDSPDASATATKPPDALFASKVFTVGASIATGGLDRLVQESGGPRAACRSPFLTALGLMQSFRMRRQSALPIILKALLSRARFEDLAAVTRKAASRFDPARCAIPSMVASLAMSALDGDDVDALVERGKVDDLAMMASLSTLPMGILGSTGSRVRVLERIADGASGPRLGTWLSLLGEALLEDGRSVEALKTFRKASSHLEKAAKLPSLAGAFVAAVSSRAAGRVVADAASDFLKGGPHASLVYESIAAVRPDDGKPVAVGALAEAARSLTPETRRTVAEAFIKVVDVDPGSGSAYAVLESIDGLGVQWETEDRVVLGLVRGRHLVKAGDLDGALKVFRDALEPARPNMGSAVAGTASLVGWLAFEKTYGLMEEVVRLASRRNVVPVAALAQAASIVGENGKPAMAVALLQRAVARKPVDESQWLAIADAYSRIEKMDLAEDALSRLGSPDGWGPGPWMTKGRMEMSRHRYRDAAAAYGKAAELARGECEPLFFRGLVRLLMGDPQGAERDFQQCLEFGTASHQVYGGLGYARFDQSRFVDAMEAFEKALEIDRDTADNNIGLALTLFRMGRVEEARAAFGAAVRLEPSMASGYEEAETRGYIYTEVEKKAWEDMMVAFSPQADLH